MCIRVVTGVLYDVDARVPLLDATRLVGSAEDWFPRKRELECIFVVVLFV